MLFAYLLVIIIPLTGLLVYLHHYSSHNRPPEPENPRSFLPFRRIRRMAVLSGGLMGFTHFICLTVILFPHLPVMACDTTWKNSITCKGALSSTLAPVVENMRGVSEQVLREGKPLKEKKGASLTGEPASLCGVEQISCISQGHSVNRAHLALLHSRWCILG